MVHESPELQMPGQRQFHWSLPLPPLVWVKMQQWTPGSALSMGDLPLSTVPLYEANRLSQVKVNRPDSCPQVSKELNEYLMSSGEKDIQTSKFSTFHLQKELYNTGFPFYQLIKIERDREYTHACVCAWDRTGGSWVVYEKPSSD